MRTSLGWLFYSAKLNNFGWKKVMTEGRHFRLVAIFPPQSLCRPELIHTLHMLMSERKVQCIPGDKVIWNELQCFDSKGALLSEMLLCLLTHKSCYCSKYFEIYSNCDLYFLKSSRVPCEPIFFRWSTAIHAKKILQISHWTWMILVQWDFK